MGSSVCSYLGFLILFGWWGEQESVVGISKPVSDTSTVLACAGLQIMNPHRFTISTMVVSPLKHPSLFHSF
jgi:hypothetical protein